MTGSSFVRISDEQVLPLQYFNTVFQVVLKGLIERPAHTEREVKKSHCDGRRWAPGRGTGTGTARLRVTCILNTASG